MVKRAGRSSAAGRRLVQSMKEAVAIAEGRLPAARRHKYTAREATVSPPPRYGPVRVRRVRDALGLSQALFARALNVSLGTVRGWEQGARVPDGPSRRLLELVERHPETALETIRPTLVDDEAAA